MHPKAEAIHSQRIPHAYQAALLEEANLTTQAILNQNLVIDVGCGIGRIIPYVAPLVGRYVGIDNDPKMLDIAYEKAAGYGNVILMRGDARELRPLFQEKEFDTAICLWNTLGKIREDRLALRNMAEISRNGVILGVAARGTLPIRQSYYDQLGIPYQIDQKTEVISSPMWGRARAYSPSELEDMASDTGLVVEEIKNIQDLMFLAILRRQ